MNKNMLIQPDLLAQAADEALAAEPVTSVLQVDLDDFLGVNEAGGREAGDRVLAAAASVLAATAKKEGWSVVRVGGDEFALVAPGLGLEQAFLRAEALRQALAEEMTKAAPDGRRATASVGVANAPRDAKSALELLRKADLALYSAKEQGGDAVGLTPGDEMALKSSYYGVAQLARLKSLAERQKTKEAVLLREALDELLRKYDRS